MTRNDLQRAVQTLTVYKAASLRVVNGANLGDSLSFADELMLDDVYRLLFRDVADNTGDSPLPDRNRQ
jgi:hypothetical protein